MREAGLPAPCEDQGGKSIVYNNRRVADNLRRKVKELEERLKAVREWHEDVEMDADARYRLEKILEANDE